MCFPHVTSSNLKLFIPILYSSLGHLTVHAISLGGDSAFLGIVDADMTVADFKLKLQANTGINVGWQVLLLGLVKDDIK